MVNSKLISRLLGVLFDRPIIKLVILLIVISIFIGLSDFFHDMLSLNPVINLFLVVLNLFFALYFILLIVRIIFVYLISHTLARLLNARSIVSLLFSYAVFILGILLVISLLFMQVGHFNLGYFTYGT
ncbi:MAG: hypothetical protein WCI04_07330, partial [archaeon]